VRRVAAAAIVAAAAVAGCGGGGGADGLPAGAAKAPADAVAFVSLKTDPKSAQWKQALKLASRFPGLASRLDQLGRYKDAVGSELDVVWLDFANGGDDVVALTKPRRLAALKVLLDSDTRYSTLPGGWIAVGDRAVRDRLGGGKRLDADKGFEEAFVKLDKAAAVRAWVRGAPVQGALDRSLARSGAAPRITHDLGDLHAIVATAKAEGDGVRVDGRGLIDPRPKPKTFTPSLAAAFPAGAELYVAATHLEDPTRLVLRMVAESNPNFDAERARVESVLNISLSRDVYPLLHDEAAVALYRGSPVPRLVFVQKVGDEAEADSLLRRISAVVQLSGSADVGTIQVGGTTVQTLTSTAFGRNPVTIYDGVVGGKLFVTDARPLVEQLVRGPQRSLGDDARFGAARRRAKLPGKVAAFAYGDLRSGIPFAFGLARMVGNGVPPAAIANTEPLESGLVYLVPDGDGLRLSGFTAIK
jgi:hypothetical protein